MRKKILVDGKETNYEISDMGEVFNLKTNRQLKGTIGLKKKIQTTYQKSLKNKNMPCKFFNCGKAKRTQYLGTGFSHANPQRSYLFYR